MYSSSTSSSPQGSMGSTGGGGGGLMRYGSAPGSLLTSAVDSVIGATREFSVLGSQNHLGPTARFLPSESVTMANQTREETTKDNATIGLQPSYGFGGGVPSSSSSLARHSSSPAGFFNQLASAAADNNGAGFCITRGIGNYNSKGMCESRLNPQLSFTGGRETENADHQTKSSSRSYTGGSFGSSWDQNHPINFSVAPPNGANNSKNMDYSQFEFSMSSQEMGNNNIPEDSTPCKIRAKRGFATHPRSIAERERRTKISGKLKKLQDLVPNMDKQTSYADMLDLAVKHIKALQNQVQNLHNELESCTCGCKKPRDS